MNFNTTNCISKKSLIAIYTILAGIGLLAFAITLDLYLALLLGVLLIVAGLLCFPALLVATVLEGSYLYFVALRYLGISPESTITGAYYLGIGLLTLSSLIIYCYSRQSLPKLININTSMVILFFSYILVQYALLSYTFGAYKKLIFFLVQGILPFFIGSLLTRELAGKSLKIALGLACFLSFYSMIQIFSNLSNVRYFFTGGIWNYHLQVYLLITGAIIAVCFYFFRPKSKISIWWHIAFVLYLALSFIESILASSRGGVVGFIVTMMILVVYAWKKFISKFSFRFRHVVLVVLLIMLFGTFWNIFGDKLSFSTERLSQTLQLLDLARGEISEEESARSIKVRINMIGSQYNEFADNPIVGFGFGNSAALFSYVHNMFLEVLFETGIIGLILFMGIIYLASRKILYIWRNSNRNFIIQNIYLVIFTILWFYFIAAGQFSRSLFDNYQFWFLTGALLNPLERKDIIISIPTSLDNLSTD